MKILISDKLPLDAIGVLSEVEEFEVDCRFGIAPDELRQEIKDYHALVVRSSTHVTAEIINAGDKLKVIGRAGVGLDNVDLLAAEKKGVIVLNTPFANTTATAEHTMSLILALSRNIVQSCCSLKSGEWERARYIGVELNRKMLGIVGLGRIGLTVSRMAKSFGMNVVGFDPFISKQVAQDNDIELIDFDDLLKKSDFISIHVPKNEETKNLISDKEFALMKSDAKIINCARGGIVDESALICALKENQIGGCALDVYEKEPPDFNSELFKFDNCLTTPHLGAATVEARSNVAIEIVCCVRDVLLGHKI